jgi:hypothetical protein
MYHLLIIHQSIGPPTAIDHAACRVMLQPRAFLRIRLHMGTILY